MRIKEYLCFHLLYKFNLKTNGTMKHSKQQLNWAARVFALLALFVFGGVGQRAFAQNTRPADGYYRFVSASTTEIVGSALYASGGAVCWKALDESDVSFVWKVEATTDGYYRLTNPLLDISLGDDGKVALLQQADGSYALKRPSADGWLHALSHGNVSVELGGQTTFGNVGWGFNTWTMEKLADDDPLVALAIKAKELKDKAMAAISENSTDLTPTADTERANNYADFFSNAAMTVEHGITFGSDGGGFAALIDGNANTFFHSSWNGSPQWSDYKDDGQTTVSKSDAVKADYAYATSKQNLGVKMIAPASNIYYVWTERAGQYSATPTSIDVEVSNDRENWTTAYTDYTSFSVSDAGGADVFVGPLKFDKPYQYVRFISNRGYRRASGVNNPVGYFNLAGLHVYEAKGKLASANTDATNSLFTSLQSLNNSTSQVDLQRAVNNLEAAYNSVIEGKVSGDTIVKDGYYLLNLVDADDPTTCWVPMQDGEIWRLGGYSANLSVPSAEYIWHITRNASGNYSLKNCGSQALSYPESMTKGSSEDEYVIMQGKNLQEFRIVLNTDGTAYIYPADNSNNLSLNTETGFIGLSSKRGANSLVSFVGVQATDAMHLDEALSDANGRQFTVGTEPGQVSQEDYDAFSEVLKKAENERKAPSASAATVANELNAATATLDAKVNTFADGYYYIVSTKDNSQHIAPYLESNNTYTGLKLQGTSADAALVWHITTNPSGQKVMKNLAFADSTYLAALGSGYSWQSVRMGLLSQSHQTFTNLYGNVYRIQTSESGAFLDASNDVIYTGNAYNPADNSEWAIVSVPQDAMPKLAPLVEAITDARAAIRATNVSADPGGASGDLTNINAALNNAEKLYADGASEDDASTAAKALANATEEFLAQDHSQTTPVTEGYYRLVNEGAAYMGSGTPAAYAKNGHLFWGPLDNDDPHFVFKITPQGDKFYVQSALYDTHIGTLDTLGLVAMQSEPHAVDITSAGGMLWNIINPDDNKQYVRGGGGDEMNAEFRMRVNYTSDFTRKQHNWYLRRLSADEVESMQKNAETTRVNEGLTNAIARGENAYSGAFRYDVDYSSPLITDVNPDFPRDGQVWSTPRENDKSWASYANLLTGGFRCENASDIDNKSGVPLQVDLKDKPVKDFEIKYSVYSSDWIWRESWADITVYATNDETIAGKDDLTPSEWKFVGHYTDLPVNFGSLQGHTRTFNYRIIDADKPYRFFRIMVNKTIMPQAYGRFYVGAFNIYEAVANAEGSPYNYVDGMKDAADHLRSLIVDARTKLDAGTATAADVEALNAAAKTVEDMTPNANRLNALISEVNKYIADYGAGDGWGDVTEDQYLAIQDAVAEADAYDHENPSIADLATRYGNLQNAFALYKSQQKRIEPGKWYRIVSTDITRPGTISQGGTADDSQTQFGFTQHKVIFASRDNNVGTGLTLNGYDYLTGTRADSVDASPYAMWRLVSVQDAEEGTYALQNRATGLYLGQITPTVNKGMQEEASPYEVVLIKSGQYAISSAVDNANRYPLHGYGGGGLGSWDGLTIGTAKDSPSSWNFEEVDESALESLAVNIPDNSISIVTLPFAYTAEVADINESNGIMAYAIAGISDDGKKLNLTLKNSFEAGEPFFVVANDYTLTGEEPSAVAFALPFANELSREAKTANGLVGTFLPAHPRTAGLGYIATGKVAATDAYTTIAAQTGYISTGKIVNSASATIDLQLDLPDKINGIATTAIIGKGEKADVYTIDGVLVKKGVNALDAAKGLKKGVYIVNGKKILVK